MNKLESTCNRVSLSIQSNMNSVKYPIRVLCVFARLDRGGAETMCMNLYRHVDRSKVQFDFIKHYQNVGEFENEILTLGGNIYTAPLYNGYNHLEYIQWWKMHLKSHPEHQIIHGHFYSLSPVYFSVCKKMGRTTIGHCHSMPDRNNNIKNIIKFQVKMLVERYSTICFACSKDAGHSIFRHKKFTVLSNAIDASRYIFNQSTREKIRSEFGLSDKFVVGHIGRFEPIKNHSYLIDIFEEIKAKKPNAVLVLVGTGPLLKCIQDRVMQKKLDDSVLFLGIRSDVPDLLQMMDVFLFPSIAEGLGIVAIEAQAAALHVVCTDTIPQEAKITDYLEYLPLSASPTVWADAVMKYADGYTRMNMAQEIIDAGYDVQTTSKWLENFYLDIANDVDKRMRQYAL